MGSYDTTSNTSSIHLLTPGEDALFQTLRMIQAAVTTPSCVTMGQYFDIFGSSVWSPSRYNLADTGIVDPTHFPMYPITFPQNGLMSLHSQIACKNVLFSS